MRWDEIDQQVCSVARALSVVGDRWTLLIMRDVFLGTRRFAEFQRQLGISRHRLSDRLSRLVESGVLTRRRYQDKPERFEYRLTPRGLALYPVLVSSLASGLAHEAIGEGLALRDKSHADTLARVTSNAMAAPV